MPRTSSLRPLLREGQGALKNAVPRAWWRGLKRLRSKSTGVPLSALDAHLETVAAAFARSQDEGRHALSSFHLELGELELPRDPHSAAYRDAQLKLYERISGRTHALEYERSAIDVEAATSRPYPYLTGSTAETGEQWVAIGWLLKSLGRDPPGHVLEFGPGWGHTTLALATLGFDVTAVDADPDFLELISRRAGAARERLTLVPGDMLTFEPKRPADVVLFFESFHHCSDPLRLLARLEKLIAPGGRVIFAAEPIDDFELPWGVRLDGQSVWAMRRYGWLELGFETGFFLETLRGLGWNAVRSRSFAASPLADVIVCTRG
ncbi:MAG: class I SAM-dependent methyltransferase [Myxococcaceae bacterium]